MLNLKHAWLCVLYYVFFTTCRPIAPPGAPPAVFNTSHIDRITSQTLGEERTLWISLPKSMNDTRFAPMKYPVLYLLDGAELFHAVSGMVRFLSSEKNNRVLPEMIVVGIVNTNRDRDLTPTEDTEAHFPTGGGERFLSFMEQELIPYIEDKYSAAPHRTLVGQSLGGLLTLYALHAHPELFQHHIALEPSLWWDDQYIVRQFENAKPREDWKGKGLYLAIANTLVGGRDTSVLRGDYSRDTEHIRLLFPFARKMDTTSLRFQSKYYPDEDHASVCLAGIHDGLRFLFSWYFLNEPYTLLARKGEVTDEEVFNLVTAHFENISEKMGYNILPSERFVNRLGYRYLGRRKELARRFFEMNLANYPESYSAHFAMGHYYERQKNVEQAIHFYSQARKIQNSAEVHAKIKTLKQRD